jgi:hypothetical protein
LQAHFTAEFYNRAAVSRGGSFRFLSLIAPQMMSDYNWKQSSQESQHISRGLFIISFSTNNRQGGAFKKSVALGKHVSIYDSFADSGAGRDSK